MNRINIAIITSTSGSVMNELLGIDYFKERVNYVVSDRSCKAIDVGKRNKLDSRIFESANGTEFSEHLLEFFKDKHVDLFVSFYTRLLDGRFLERYSDKIINLHPSILPACPGMDGFGDTINSKAKFIGSTIHFIDSGADTGVPIIQAACPCDDKLPLDVLRHKIFVQQCRSLLQVIKWFEERRIKYIDGRVNISGASYNIGEFSPNLDFDLAINFKA